MELADSPYEKALDHALIQCLRLFAKHGRKVRCQEMPVVVTPSDSTYTEKETAKAVEQEVVQK